MTDTNRVILIGRVGKDPEFKEFRDKLLCNFSLATGKSWKNSSGDWESHTEWHRIQCWGKLSEKLRGTLKKGDRAFVEGELKYGKYQNKDGVTVYTTDIVADVVTSAAGRMDSFGKKESVPAKADDSQMDDAPDGDDLPF